MSVHACLLVTNMSLREPTQMSFGVWIHGGPCSVAGRGTFRVVLVAW